MSLRILVSGMACNDPWQGGATWAVMQYVLGLRELGHDVWFVEPIGEEIDRRYVREVLCTFELEDRAAFVLAGSQRTLGVPYARLRSRGFDAHLNVSGMLMDTDLVDRIPVRIYLDLDPGFSQIWHEVERIDMRFDGHTHFVSVGQSIGSPTCRVPTCGVSWITALPPVHLGSWPRSDGAEGDYTTVGNWRSYGSIMAGGWQLGQRAHSMRELLALPAPGAATAHASHLRSTRATARTWMPSSATGGSSSTLPAQPARLLDTAGSSRALGRRSRSRRAGT